MRARSHESWRAWAVCLLLGASLAGAEEEVDPAKVSWDQIQAWAYGKSEQNPFVPGAQAPAASEKPPQDVEKSPEAVAQAKEEPDKPPAYEPIPGRRRPWPESADEFRKIAAVRFQEDLREASRSKEGAKARYEVFRRYDQNDQAFGELIQILQDPKRYAKLHNSEWLAGQLWQISPLISRQMAPSKVEQYYKEWDEKQDRSNADQGWWQYHQKRRKAYFDEIGAVREKMASLDLEGDVKPEELWTLCERYHGDSPWSLYDYVVALYKLRDWFPDFAQCVRGEVQWRLIDRIFSLNMNELAEKECRAMIERWPEYGQTKSGEALWRLAEALERQGNDLGRKAEGYDKWVEALELALKFQREYPKSRHHKIYSHPHPRAGSSDIKEFIGRLHGKIPDSHKRK